jgi:hypothetical protein
VGVRSGLGAIVAQQVSVLSKNILHSCPKIQLTRSISIDLIRIFLRLSELSGCFVVAHPLSSLARSHLERACIAHQLRVASPSAHLTHVAPTIAAPLSRAADSCRILFRKPIVSHSGRPLQVTKSRSVNRGIVQLILISPDALPHSVIPVTTGVAST